MIIIYAMEPVISDFWNLWVKNKPGMICLFVMGLKAQTEFGNGHVTNIYLLIFFY